MGSSVLLVFLFPVLLPKIIKIVFDYFTNPEFFESLTQYDYSEMFDKIGYSFEILMTYLTAFVGDYLAAII